MKKTIWTLVILVILALLVWVISVNKAPTETGPIKIGVIAPLTGDGAAYGEPARNIFQIAVDEINQAGGVNGRDLALVVEDGKCSGEGGASAAQKLVNVDGVKAIIGGICSGETLAAVPVAQTGGVVLFSAGASSPDLTGKSPIFSRDYPSDASQGSVIAQVAYDQGKRKIAFIQEQVDYALGVYKAFNARFTSLGGTVIKEEYPSAVKDFRSQLAKLRSQNPDGLFIDANTPSTMEAVVQQFGAMNWNVSLFTNDVLMSTPGVVEKYKATLEGTIGAEFGFDLNNPKFKHLLDTYKAKYGTDAPYQSYAQTEYDAVYILRDAIAAVGYDGKKIAAWIHALKNWQGASGSVTIGADGDRVGGHRPEIVKGGKVMSYQK